MRIIQSQPLCCIKILVSKIIVNQKKEKELSDSIRLFDFDKSTEINPNFIENEDQTDKALEQPKIYLNIVYNEKVVPPLRKDREFANESDDKDWTIIPISFSPSKERWSGSGMKCIHIDAHVNTCVANMFKSSALKIGSITNNIL